MIRGTLCAILIILSLLPAIPLSSQTGHDSQSHQIGSLQPVVGHDPNGTLLAFNATRAQFDLFTKVNATSPGTAQPTWFNNTFTNSQTGAPVPWTSFNVTIPSGTAATQNVTWNKIIVPKGNVSSTTYLRFDWRGTLSNQTEASYFVYNETGHAAIYSFSTKGNITGGPPNITAPTGSPPVGCGPSDNCLDVSKYIGFNLTLTFKFDSNSTGKGLNVNVNNIAVVSADPAPINAYSHSMGLDPTDLTGMTVNHKADILISSGYFANVTYPKPNVANAKLNHTWSQMILIFYYPNSYTSVMISQNSTSIFPTIPPASPILQGNCPTFFFCTDTHLVSLNMTSQIRHALITINANSVNLAASVQTTLGGTPTPSWGPGDLLQVRINLRHGVNVTGSDIVSANKTGIVRVTQTFTKTREGVSLLNFTKPIPQDLSLLGIWAVNSTFINGYDFGYNLTSFTLQQLSAAGFSYSGDNQRLTTQGTLTYAFNPPPSVNVNGYVFAIDSGAGAAPLSTPTLTSGPTGPGIYVSNITLVNGVFTSGTPLIMTFTLVNPAKAGMTANLTINHEFVGGVLHNSNVTIPVPPGSDTFTLQSAYVYRLNATFTPAGIKIVAVGVTSGGTPVSAMLPPGNPPVTSLRQHAGIFKISVLSKALSSAGNPPCQSTCTNSLESPAYAYVLVNPPVPGRLLASGSFTTSASGVYTATISSGRILGATRLTFLSLGIDASGLAITVQGQSTQESTLLESTLESLPTATQNQPMTLTLHLKSDSTTVNMNISITLNIQDSNGKTQVSQTAPGILIAHGQTKDASFNFNAPGSIGAYTVTFLSADYGAPLIAGTLQVSLLQSNLQVLIPAIIGVAAAIAILLFFLFRKKPIPSPEPTTKDKGGRPKPNPGTSSSKSLT